MQGCILQLVETFRQIPKGYDLKEILKMYPTILLTLNFYNYSIFIEKNFIKKE